MGRSLRVRRPLSANLFNKIRRALALKCPQERLRRSLNVKRRKLVRAATNQRKTGTLKQCEFRSRQLLCVLHKAVCFYVVFPVLAETVRKSLVLTFLVF